MRKICIALFFLFTVSVYAQSAVFSKRYQVNSNNLRAHCATTAFNGGVLFAGIYNGQDLFAVKTDSIGNVEWGNSYSFAVAPTNNEAVCRTVDSCYALTFNSGSGVGVVKLRRDGTIKWSKSIVVTGAARDIQQTKDKGFIVSGQNTFAQITKLDSLGNLQWKKSVDAGDQMDRGVTVKQLPDSSYIALIYSQRSYSSSSMGEATLLSFSKTGSLNWAKSYNKPTPVFNNAIDMEVVEDGIVILIDAYATNPHVLLKTDVLGNVVWCRSYGANGAVGSVEPRSLRQTSDKGFVFGFGDIIKTDSIGMPQWINSFTGPQPLVPFELIENKNKTITSLSSFYGMAFTEEAHLTTMDSLGNSAACTQTLPTSVYFENWVGTAITPTITSGGSVVSISAATTSISVSSFSGCASPVPWGINELENSVGVEISPNPSQGIYTLLSNENCSYTISNITGKIIAEGKCENKAIIDISEKANGIYILKISDVNGKLLDTRKLIKK